MKLQNIQKGYAEFYDVVNNRLSLGVVQQEDFVSHTDFDEDMVYYTKRWVPYVYTGEGSLNGYTQVGRLTGYATRKEALRGWKEVLEMW